MKNRPGLRAVAVVALVVGASIATARGALAAPPAVTCGSTVTTDTTLTADLTCPAGDGIVVAAPVTIDLGGHAVTGTSAAIGIKVIYPNAVTIRHGRLTGWGTGVTEVALEQHPTSVGYVSNVTAVTFLHDGTGLLVRPTDSIGEIFPATWTVDRSWFVANGNGVDNAANNDVVVNKSSFSSNAIAVEQAAGNYDGGGGATVSATKFADNGTAFQCIASGCELYGNGFIDNATAVRSLAEFTSLDMTGNTVSGSMTGVEISENLGVTVAGNVFTGNHTALTANVFSGTISNNQFTQNGTGLNADLIETYQMYGTPEITKNRVSASSKTGITVLGKANVGSNSSDFNGGRGIYAPKGVDLGGNTATGNGVRPQCIGVVC